MIDVMVSAGTAAPQVAEMQQRALGTVNRTDEQERGLVPPSRGWTGALGRFGIPTQAPSALPSWPVK